MRSFGHPAFEEGDFLGVELLARVDRRHANRIIFRRDTLDQLAGFELAGDNRESPPQIRFGAFFIVQTKIAQPLRLVGPMAGVALVGKDGPDVAVEIDRRAGLVLGRGGCGTGGEKGEQSCAKGSVETYSAR